MEVALKIFHYQHYLKKTIGLNNLSGLGIEVMELVAVLLSCLHEAFQEMTLKLQHTTHLSLPCIILITQKIALKIELYSW